MAQQQNQIAKQRAWIQSDTLKNQILEALPQTSKGGLDRFMRCLYTQVQKNPKILQCTQASIFSCAISSAQVGIEPDGDRAYLIPYKETCTLIIGYKGLVELAMRSGNVSKIHADIVCENDDFEYDRGELVRHRINFRQPRGAMYAAYAMVRYKDGVEQVEVLAKDEIDAVRAVSQGKNAEPWTKWYNEMAKKTAFRRLAKWIKLSPEAHDVLEMELAGEKNVTPRVKDAKASLSNVAEEMFSDGGDDGSVEGEASDVPAKKEEPAKEEPKGDISSLSKSKAIGRINTQLNAAKLERSQLLGWAKEQNICKPDAEDIDGITVEHLHTILTDWETIVPQLSQE